jgi:hypothetical protein
MLFTKKTTGVISWRYIELTLQAKRKLHEAIKPAVIVCYNYVVCVFEV